MYQKDIRVRRLNDMRPIKWAADRRAPKNTITEGYLNTKGEEVFKNISIY